eukprot:6186902-Pleurochrysis_carterae.AAC.7
MQRLHDTLPSLHGGGGEGGGGSGGGTGGREGRGRRVCLDLRASGELCEHGRVGLIRGGELRVRHRFDARQAGDALDTAHHALD